MAYNSPYTGQQVDDVVGNAINGTGYTHSKTPTSSETPDNNACVTYGYLDSLLPLENNNGGTSIFASGESHTANNGKAVHPIGYIFEWSNVKTDGTAISGAPDLTTANNVALYFGYGTWELFGEGRVTVGYNSADSDFSTVGNKSGSKGAWYHSHPAVSLTGSVNGIAPQSSSEGLNGSGICSAYAAGVVRHGGSSGGKRDAFSINASHSHGASGSTSNQLNVDKANMPPYIVVYRWIRTA